MTDVMHIQETIVWSTPFIGQYTIWPADPRYQSIPSTVLSYNFTLGGTFDPDFGYFQTLDQVRTYMYTTTGGADGIISQINSTMGATLFTLGHLIPVDKGTYDMAIGVTSVDTRSTTTGTGATGFQVDAAKDAEIEYMVSAQATASIGGSADSGIVLEICPTNSATAGDWKEMDRLENIQAITLAIALQSVQTIKDKLSCRLPAGWFAKLRTLGSGTHTETLIYGYKTIKG